MFISTHHHYHPPSVGIGLFLAKVEVFCFILNIDGHTAKQGSQKL